MKAICSFIFISLLFLVSCQSETGYIKSARYYGFSNPQEQNDVSYLNTDLDTVNVLFNDLKRTQAHTIKGQSRYLIIETGNDTELTLQISSEAPYPMRVIKEKRTTDMWYEFKDHKSINRWEELLKTWTEELHKKD